MPAIDLTTPRDEVKPPQFVVEGATPATFGITPTNPAYVHAGRNSRLVEGAVPTVAELRESGNSDRQALTKTREVNTVTYRGFFRANEEALLAYAMNKPAGSATADESRSWVWSRNLLGVETFIQYLGCKPQSVTLTDDNAGYLLLEIVMSYKSRVEDTTGPSIGTGSFATPDTTTPLTHVDGGTGKFTYNAAAKEGRAYTITVDHEAAIQDDSGSVQDLFVKPTIHRISGTVNIFSKEIEPEADAHAQTTRAASIVIDTGLITATFTNFVYKPSGQESDGDTSDATIESKSYEADTIVIA